MTSDLQICFIVVEPFQSPQITDWLIGHGQFTLLSQALHAILGTPGDTTAVSVLYGNRSQSDILVHETLQNWQEQFPDRLTVAHVLSDEPKVFLRKSNRMSKAAASVSR